MEVTRRILLLTPAIPPDSITAATRAGRIWRYLPKYGFEVDVIAEGETPASVPGVWRVGRRPGAAPAPLLSRFAYLVKRVVSHDDQLPWAAQVYATAARLAQSRRYDAVLSTAPPMGVHLSALLLKRRRGIPAVCDFRDPLVGNPFRELMGYVHYDGWLESFIARNADAVICNTDAARDEFRRRHPRQAQDCHLVWNGFEPEERGARDAGGGGPIRVVAHVGTLYGGRDPSSLLLSLRRLASAGRLRPGSVTFRIAGPILAEMQSRFGALSGPLARQGFLEIDNREIPRQEALHIARSADASLIIDTNGRQVSLQVPAKLFTSILLGRPVLALTYEGSPTQSVLNRSGVPCRCIDPRWEPDRIDAELDAFLRLSSHFSPPSEWFLETFNGERQVGEVARILDGCIRRAAAGRSR